MTWPGTPWPPGGTRLAYSAGRDGRTPRTFALVSFFCWVGLVACVVMHVSVMETATLRRFEPAATTPLVLGTLLLWIVAAVAGFDGVGSARPAAPVAILSLCLCLLSVPAAFLLWFWRYVPA